MSSRDVADVSEDVSMFESAVQSPRLELAQPAVESIVVAVDGSNQDETARAFAKALAARTGARVHEIGALTSAKDILQACAQQQAHLLVAPVPFGRDIRELRDESLGAVVDLLLQESTFPVFCIRQPHDADAVDAALSDLLLPVNVGDEEWSRPAGWAFRILRKGENLELVAIADQDVLEEAQKLLGDAVDEEALETEALNRAVSREVAGLIAAVQRNGQAAGIGVHVETKIGRSVDIGLEAANQRPRLMVVGAPKDHTDPAYHRAADFILGARGPVLVV